MNPQWGYGQPQQQRFPQSGLGIPQGLQPQMTGFAPGGLRPQPTGMYMQSQPTGFHPGLGGGQFAPPVPPMPSQFQTQPPPPVPNFPPRFGGALSVQPQPVLAQPTGFGAGFGAMAGSGFRALAPTFMNTFMPANPQQPAMPSNQMQFAQQVQSPNAPSLQQSFQQYNQQQSGTAQVPIPWALSKDEKKNYDQIFRAWDQAGTGFISGETAKEVFGQSGLPRDDLMAIWTLSDVDNRGRLNQAEFHVAMGLIYRRLNGNPMPQQLPPELVPPSSRDIEGSVDFVKGLLSKDTNVRATSGTGYLEGDNTKARSFYNASPQPSDGSIYRHNDSETMTYKSRDRHIDRRNVRSRGDESADGDIAEIRRGLDSAQSLLDSSKSRREKDDELKQELSDLKYRIKRVQEDIEYITRSGRRSEANETERRKLERELTRLKYEQLPDLERKMEEREKEEKRERMKYSMERDERNQRNQNRYANDGEEDRYGYNNDYGPRGSYDKNDGDRDRGSRGSYHNPDPQERSYDSTPREPIRPTSSFAKPPPPPAPRPITPASAPTKLMSTEERQAFIRAEAQRRVQERLRALGVGGGESKADVMDSSVTQRLERDAEEAAAKAALADKEMAEREKQRQEKLAREKQKNNPDEEKSQTSSAPPAPLAAATVAAKPNPPIQSTPPVKSIRTPLPEPEEDPEERALHQQEEALKRRKAEAQARMKKLEQELEEERQKEEAAEQMRKNRQMFAQQAKSNKPPPAPISRSKVAPPPPVSRKVVPPVVNQTPIPKVEPASAPRASTTVSSPPPSTTAVPTVSPLGTSSPLTPAPSSTNPFHKLVSGGTTSPSPAIGPNNPFFRTTNTVAAPSPAPSFPSASFPVAASPAPVKTPKASVPADDDDWDADETASNESSDDDGAIKKRNFRANLANKIFGGGAGSPVPETPTAGTPTRVASSPIAPMLPLESPAPPPPPPPPAPSAPASAASAPLAPPPPKNISGSDSSGQSRNALLSQIQGGLKLRKSVTNDRSGVGVSGRVIGDSSPPVQTYIPPRSPPIHASQPPSPAAPEPESIDKRQSVDWYSSLASKGLSPMAHTATLETTLEEPEGHKTVPSIQVDTAVADTDEFDMSTVLKSRALYAFEGQRDEELSFDANVVIFAHPAKDVENDWWFGSTYDKTKTGQFPKTYVESINLVGKATALYAYLANSTDEISLQENEVVDVIDNTDPDWWRVESKGLTGLVPASYLELGNSEAVKSESATSTNTTTTEHSALMDSMRLTSLSHNSSSEEEDDEAEDEAESSRRALERLQVLRAAGMLQKTVSIKRRPSQRPAPPVRTRQETIDADSKIRNSTISIRNQGHEEDENDADLEDAYTRYQELLARDPSPSPRLESGGEHIHPDPESPPLPELSSSLDSTNKPGDKFMGWLGLARPPSIASSTTRPNISLPSSVKSRPMSSGGSMQTISWSSIIDPSALQTIPEKERRRQEAIFEFINTEQTYLKSLQLLMEVFFTGLHGLLPSKATEVIFGGIDDILLFNTSFLSSLEDRQRDHRMYIDGIGDVIEEHIVGVAVYRNYCVNQGNAARVLANMKSTNPSIKDRLDSLSINGLKLEHFLLEPMQRLTRYPLLINQIIRYTPEEHFDHPQLLAALKTVETVLTNVNETIRDQEDLEKLVAISNVLDFGVGPEEKLDLTLPTQHQGRRRLLREASLTKGKKSLKCYIFNDLLLVSEVRDRTELVWLGPLPLEEISFREMSRDNISLELQHRGDNFRLKAANGRARAQLMKELESSRTACIKAQEICHSRINSRTSFMSREESNTIPDFSGI